MKFTLVAAETTVPKPCVKPTGPYSISHGPVLDDVHESKADVANGVADNAVLTKHC